MKKKDEYIQLKSSWKNAVKKRLFCFILLFSLSYLTGCTEPTQPADPHVQHTDPFYNFNHNDYPLLHLPLINPVEAKCEDGRSPWRVFLHHGPAVRLPDRQGIVIYFYAVEELEKFAVQDGVIMAYSAYVNTEADPYIQENYYHWFVIFPGDKEGEGFQTEGPFLQYIQTLGVQEPDWQTPDEAYKQFEKTGCLAWIPDCQ